MKPTQSKEALATLERLLERGAISPHAALQAAYQLGEFDGLLAMAKVGLDKTVPETKIAA